jgi:hypothetical protein
MSFTLSQNITIKGYYRPNYDVFSDIDFSKGLFWESDERNFYDLCYEYLKLYRNDEDTKSASDEIDADIDAYVSWVGDANDTVQIMYTRSQLFELVRSAIYDKLHKVSINNEVAGEVYTKLKQVIINDTDFRTRFDMLPYMDISYDFIVSEYLDSLFGDWTIRRYLLNSVQIGSYAIVKADDVDYCFDMDGMYDDFGSFLKDWLYDFEYVGNEKTL